MIWDFDVTLATRPGNWTGALCEVVASKYADLGIGPDRLRPHLQSGFPWHTPEIVRRPCSEEEWWEQLLPVLAQALRSGADLPDAEARELAGRVRARYLDPKSWQVFEDVLPVLRELRGRGWKHIVLSNHVPELPRLTEALGLSSFLIDVYCSGRTGAEKPHPKAFEPVFADHPEARAGWMIGDSWRADVQVNLFRRRRQAGQVEGRPAQQRPPVRRLGRRQTPGFEPSQDEAVDVRTRPGRVLDGRQGRPRLNAALGGTSGFTIVECGAVHGRP